MNGPHMLFVYIVTLHFSLGLIIVCYAYKHISSLFNVTHPVHGLAEHSQYSNSLWARWSGDQSPVGVRFSAPIQTSFAPYPASCAMDAWSLSWG